MLMHMRLTKVLAENKGGSVGDRLEGFRKAKGDPQVRVTLCSNNQVNLLDGFYLTLLCYGNACADNLPHGIVGSVFQ